MWTVDELNSAWRGTFCEVSGFVFTQGCLTRTNNENKATPHKVSIQNFNPLREEMHSKFEISIEQRKNQSIDLGWKTAVPHK